MKKYLIKEEVLQKLLDYLSTKPYSEVVTLIQLIRLSEPYTEEENATND